MGKVTVQNLRAFGLLVVAVEQVQGFFLVQFPLLFNFIFLNSNQDL